MAALLSDFEGKDVLFVCGVFGVQHEGPDSKNEQHVVQLHRLLMQSAGWVDVLKDETRNIEVMPLVFATTTFVAYWLNHGEFKAWRDTTLKPFWDHLPDDAGLWREIMTVPKSRHMYSTSQPVATGIGSMVGLTASSDMGYWGVYRHRMAQNQDQHTDSSDTFPSPYTSKPSSNADNGKKLVNLERHLDAPKEELDNWQDMLNPYFRSLVDHLTTARNKNGIVSFSSHLAKQCPDSTLHPAQQDPILPEAHQLLYCLDLADFELSGRSFKDHVTLRNTMMKLYGPGGKFFGHSKLHLVVEVSVLKSADLEAEYIGCREGTRLMILEDL